MSDRELGVKPEKEEACKCGGVGCPCACEDCTCKPDVEELLPETAALVAEFSHRELS